MCTAADQPASRNTHRFVNGSPPPIPRLDLEEKENEITPVVVVLVLMAGPDAPLSLCEPCCLTVHFFPSSFLFSFLSFFLFSKLLPLLLLSPSLDCKPLQDARANESTARNKFTVDCFYSLSSLPSSLRGGAPSGREEAFARINRAVPFDTTSHHRTVPILSTAARRSSESIYTKKKRRKNEATIEGTIEVSPRRSFLLYRGTIDDTWIEGRYRNSSIHILPPWLEKRTDRKVKWRLVLVDRSAPRVPLSYARVSPHLWTSTRSLIHTGTSTCSHAVCPVHTRILRWRGGEGVARQLQHHRCCCCLQSGVLYCQPCRGLANAIHRASRSCCASVRQSTISLSSFSPLFVRYTPPHRLLSCVSWRRADLLRRSHSFPYVRDSNRDWSMVQITRKSKPLVCNSRCLRISARLLSRECRSIEDFFKDRRGIWII